MSPETLEVLSAACVSLALFFLQWEIHHLFSEVQKLDNQLSSHVRSSKGDKHTTKEVDVQ